MPPGLAVSVGRETALSYPSAGVAGPRLVQHGQLLLSLANHLPVTFKPADAIANPARAEGTYLLESALIFFIPLHAPLLILYVRVQLDTSGRVPRKGLFVLRTEMFGSASAGEECQVSLMNLSGVE